MEDDLIPVTLLMVSMFLGSWALLNALVLANKTGVIYVKGMAYFKHDNRRFHGSDFYAIMVFCGLILLILLALFVFLLIALATTNDGAIALLVCLFLNLYFSLRPNRTKKDKPNRSHSIVLTIGIIAIMTATVTFTFKGYINLVPSIPVILVSGCLLFIHFKQFKSGKFMFKSHSVKKSSIVR